MARANNNDEMDDRDNDGLDAGLDDISESDVSEPINNRDEASAETRSVSSRCRIREQLDSEVAAFLASGGCISQIDPRIHAEPRPIGGRYGAGPL